jgi:hypothetical protein
MAFDKHSAAHHLARKFAGGPTSTRAGNPNRNGDRSRSPLATIAPPSPNRPPRDPCRHKPDVPLRKSSAPTAPPSQPAAPAREPSRCSRFGGTSKPANIPPSPKASNGKRKSDLSHLQFAIGERRAAENDSRKSEISNFKSQISKFEIAIIANRHSLQSIKRVPLPRVFWGAGRVAGVLPA